MIEFLLFALAAGLMTSAIAGPLGSLLVWQRMAYFSDTLAHSSLLGIALGLLLSINGTLAVLVICLFIGLSLIQLQLKTIISNDTLLAVLSHCSLALGLIVMSTTQTTSDLRRFLMGDILATDGQDLIQLAIMVVITLGLLVFFWRPLVAYTASPVLAQLEGLPVKRLRLLMVILLSLVVAVALNVVGVLLISALLIIPAATAKQWATSPEQMAIIASIISALSVIGGLGLSVVFDNLPAGPAIVVCSGVLFVVSLSFKNTH